MCNDTKNKAADLFDSLTRIESLSKGSKWQGKQGKYYIERLNGNDKRIAKVLLNHKFLTGLFRTKRNDIYSGDFLIDNKQKVLLSFHVRGDKMNIYVVKKS